MDMYHFLSNGGVSKLFGYSFYFIIALGSACILGYQVLNNIPPNPVLSTFVGGVMLHTATQLGYNAGAYSTASGVNLGSATTNSSPSAPLPPIKGAP